MNYLKLCWWAACLLIAGSAFAVEFAPTSMDISVPEQVAYEFDGSVLAIDVAISGVGGQFWLVINTKGQAENINMVRNGFMGWHTVNKIDTTVYISQPYTFQPGMRIMSWDGRDNDGGYATPASYDYFVYGYDNVNERIPACMFIQAGSGWRTHNTFILEEDENGQPLANPILTSTVQPTGDYSYLGEDAGKNGSVLKWVIGADPYDFHNLQWTNCAIYPDHSKRGDVGYYFAGGSAFDPQDHGTFYHVNHNVDGAVATLQKWAFVNNGNAILDESWGGWDKIVFEKDMSLGYWSEPMSTITDGSFLYINDSEQTGVPEHDEASKNWLYCYEFSGNKVFSENMQEFYMPDDPSYRQNCAMLDLEPGTYENSMFIGTMGCCIHEFIETTSLIVGQAESEADYLRWRNGQGDFYFDVYWEQNAEYPWACLNNAEHTTHRIDTVQVDANGFNIIFATFIGNASHGVSTQDGTSLMPGGYMSYADDDLGDSDTYRGGGKIVDNGSVYDGMYVAPAPPLHFGTHEVYYVANASAGGVILNSSSGEDVYIVYGHIEGGEGSTVTLSDQQQAFQRQATADDNGNYVFTGIPKGEYTLTPEKAGYVFIPESVSFTVTDQHVAVEDIIADAGEPGDGVITLTAPASAGAGDTFEVSIDVNDVEALFGISFQLAMWPGWLIEDVTVTKGPFLGDNIVYYQNVADEVLSVAMSRKSGQEDVSGEGNLLTVTFKIQDEINESTAFHMNVTDIEGIDSNGVAVIFEESPPVSMQIMTGQFLAVWPGDTNNNGIVNQADVLPLGMYWNLEGPPRENAAINWAMQEAEPWDIVAATYADANGNGVVDQADILPIGLNWERTPSAGKLPGPVALLSAQSDLSGQLVVSHNQAATLEAGTEFWVDISAIDVDALFGVSFEIETDGKAYIEPVSAEAGPFLGDDVLFFYDIDAVNKAVSLGITKKREQQDATGSGVVARVKYNVIRDITPDTMISLAMTDILGNCASGSTVALSCNSLVLGHPDVLVAESSREFSVSNNYPNPFNPTTTIAYTLPEEGFITITVYNSSGQKIETITEDMQAAGYHSVVWNAEGKPSGLYFYNIKGDRFSETRKMLLIK